MAQVKRRESSHANQRKQIRLIELKSVDLVATDDALQFVYKDRVFSATVSKSGHIAAEHKSVHKPFYIVDNVSYYQRPSNFTNDCVSVYWDELIDSSVVRTDCHTNPSGYERIKHIKSGKTLNQLRDEYMKTHISNAKNTLLQSVPVDELRSPEDIVNALELKSAPDKKRKRVPPSRTDDDYTLVDFVVTEHGDDGDDASSKNAADVGSNVASLLADSTTTIATLRASGRGRGYKQIAEVLQQKLAKRSQALHTLMLCVEKYHQNTSSVETEAAREAAQLISAYVNSKVQAEEDEEMNHSVSSSSSSSATTASNYEEPDFANNEMGRISAAELDGILSMSLAGMYKH